MPRAAACRSWVAAADSSAQVARAAASDWHSAAAWRLRLRRILFSQSTSALWVCDTRAFQTGMQWSWCITKRARPPGRSACRISAPRARRLHVTDRVLAAHGVIGPEGETVAFAGHYGLKLGKAAEVGLRELLS